MLKMERRSMRLERSELRVLKERGFEIGVVSEREIVVVVGEIWGKIGLCGMFVFGGGGGLEVE